MRKIVLAIAASIEVAVIHGVSDDVISNGGSEGSWQEVRGLLDSRSEDEDDISTFLKDWQGPEAETDVGSPGHETTDQNTCISTTETQSSAEKLIDKAQEPEKVQAPTAPVPAKSTTPVPAVPPQPVVKAPQPVTPAPKPTVPTPAPAKPASTGPAVQTPVTPAPKPTVPAPASAQPPQQPVVKAPQPPSSSQEVTQVLTPEYQLKTDFEKLVKDFEALEAQQITINQQLRADIQNIEARCKKLLEESNVAPNEIDIDGEISIAEKELEKLTCSECLKHSKVNTCQNTKMRKKAIDFRNNVVMKRIKQNKAAQDVIIQAIANLPAKKDEVMKKMQASIKATHDWIQSTQNSISLKKGSKKPEQVSLESKNALEQNVKAIRNLQAGLYLIKTRITGAENAFKKELTDYVAQIKKSQSDLNKAREDSINKERIEKASLDKEMAEIFEKYNQCLTIKLKEILRREITSLPWPVPNSKIINLPENMHEKFKKINLNATSNSNLENKSVSIFEENFTCDPICCITSGDKPTLELFYRNLESTMGIRISLLLPPMPGMPKDVHINKDIIEDLFSEQESQEKEREVPFCVVTSNLQKLEYYIEGLRERVSAAFKKYHDDTAKVTCDDKGLKRIKEYGEENVCKIAQDILENVDMMPDITDEDLNDNLGIKIKEYLDRFYPGIEKLSTSETEMKALVCGIALYLIFGNHLNRYETIKMAISSYVLGSLTDHQTRKHGFGIVHPLTSEGYFFKVFMPRRFYDAYIRYSGMELPDNARQYLEKEYKEHRDQLLIQALNGERSFSVGSLTMPGLLGRIVQTAWDIKKKKILQETTNKAIIECSK